MIRLGTPGNGMHEKSSRAYLQNTEHSAEQERSAERPMAICNESRRKPYILIRDASRAVQWAGRYYIIRNKFEYKMRGSRLLSYKPVRRAQIRVWLPFMHGDN